MQVLNGLHLTKFGIEFEYGGDWIIYLWPWKRTFKDHPLYSKEFHHCYRNFGELNHEWSHCCKA